MYGFMLLDYPRSAAMPWCSRDVLVRQQAIHIQQRSADQFSV
jgi:hypothetical protein